jgi:hypothetical protein
MHDALVTSDDPTAALLGFVELLSETEADTLHVALGALVD